MSDAPIEIVQHAQLFDRLDKIIAEHRQHSWGFALLLIGIKKFRRLNINHDFRTGDELLGEFYRRLSGLARDQDIVIRTGSSEFLMLIPKLLNEGHATLAAYRLLDELGKVYNVAGKQIRISASIGGAIYPEHGHDAPALLQNSEIALVEARCKVESYCFYSEVVDSSDRSNWDVGSELQAAIEQEQLELHFQPQVDLESGRVTGAEALLRWNHPQRGNVRPDYFIPAAEQSDAIYAITDWTIQAAMWHIRDWPQDHGTMNISVNLSPRIFEHEGLVESIHNSAEIFETGLEHLVLEVTESALVTDMPTTIGILDELKELGVGISIDDFGTGYSSMSYFKCIPANELKVDRSFVGNILENPMDLHIVRSIIDMARGFGLTVVAEGIEDRETFDLLKTMGCNIGQGNYVSEPMPQSAFLEWLDLYNQVR